MNLKNFESHIDAKETLEGIVTGLDKITLASFVLDYASRNKRFRDDILVRFSKTPDVTRYARRLIKETINDVMYRGFVEYADVRRAVEGAYAVLEMVEKQPDIFMAVNLCFVILEEMVKLEQSCDDSNGEARLYPHLLPEYLDDVDALFLQYIRYCAKLVSSRSGYHTVCEVIGEYQKACGKTRADSIIAKLREQHHRQPAFLDELRRIG